jgi:hypothetical protein
MQSELDAMPDDTEAFWFAIGCLGCAARERLSGFLLVAFRGSGNQTSTSSNQEGIEMRLVDPLRTHPKLLGAICVIIATTLGLAYMWAAAAPLRYLATNAAALPVAFVLVVSLALLFRGRPKAAGAAILSLALVLLGTAFFGEATNDANRWVSLGDLRIQVSAIVVPVIVVSFARASDPMAVAGIVIAALALALQPDRAMSGALAAGLAVVASIRRERSVLIALAAAVIGFAAAVLRADTLPASPFVEQVLYSSFAVHPLAGIAVLLGLAMLVVPAIAGWRSDPGNRVAYVAFGSVWLAIIAAAVLANFPTPVVGYGGSAIIGYVASVWALPGRLKGPRAQSPGREGPAADHVPDSQFRSALA